jgi:hypothetical protein
MCWDDGLARMAATTKTGGSAAGNDKEKEQEKKRKRKGQEHEKGKERKNTYLSNKFGQMST